VKEVKQRFGKNSVHLEYEGDGKFLNELPFVRQATVYGNYAELVLNNSTSSNEIIEAISHRLEIRKFEFVEPSLNAIFIEVVGIPAVVEQSEPQPASSKQQRPSIFQDKRIKREFLSLVIFAGITLVVFVAALLVKNLSLTTAGIFFLGTLATLFKFVKVRNKVIAERRTEEKEGKPGEE